MADDQNRKGFPGLYSRGSQIEYFRKKLESLSAIEDPKERYCQEILLLEVEFMAEQGYREGVMQGRMLGLGLYPTKMRLIAEGMVNSFQRLDPSDALFQNARDCQTYIQARSSILLDFEMEYIDRWIMYDRRFGEHSAFAQKPAENAESDSL